jgi:hypothetical protein
MLMAESNCNICLDNTNDFYKCTHCNNEFCTECSKKMGKCPMCRAVYNQAFVDEQERVHRLEQEALSEQYIQELIGGAGVQVIPLGNQIINAVGILHFMNHIIQGIGQNDDINDIDEPPAGNYQVIDSINQLYNNEITPENFRDTINSYANISDNHKNMITEYTSFYVDGYITRDDYTTYAREMLNEYIEH